MVGFPPDTPVTTPEEDPTVARAVLLLLQVPPEVASVNVVVKNGQTTAVPPIAAGEELTVTGVVILHPVGSV